MKVRNLFFCNSIGLGIFGLTKGDYTKALVCFTADGKDAQVNLEINYFPESPETLEIKSGDGILNAKSDQCLKVVQPTREYLEQQFSADEGVIKVKVTLISEKDPAREPMVFDADSTGWKWPSYYIDDKSDNK